MIVLGRRQSEAIMIGDNVVVTVVEILADEMRLGVSAPDATPIYQRQDEAETKAAPASDPQPIRNVPGGMTVITCWRRVRLVIGADITIYVADMREGGVRLGIEVPKGSQFNAVGTPPWIKSGF